MPPSDLAAHLVVGDADVSQRVQVVIANGNGRVAGLEGLRFVHSGYLVRDLSEAVPRPAPRARAPTVRREPPSARVDALDATTLAAREQARRHAAQLLPAAATAPADDCIDLLDRWAEDGRSRWKKLDAAARAERVAALAAAYGDLVCRALGWHWVSARRGEEGPWLAVADAANSCALLVSRIAERQFTPDGRNMTLQFNMLRTGQLPPPPAQGVALLG